MSQTGGAVTQEDMESLIGEVISRNTSSDSEEKPRNFGADGNRYYS